MALIDQPARWLGGVPVQVRVGLLAVLCFFIGLGSTPLFDVDEGAFSAATMEMLARGNFVMTYLGGLPRFDKPILIYWLQAASVSVFGLHEWALRLPSALAATGWLLITWQFARRFGENTALFAAAVLGCGLAPMIIGRSATADALLNLLIAAALLDAWRFLESGKRAPLLRMYAWIGFGLLTKGPIAVLVPLMATFSWSVLAGEWRRFLRAVFEPLGWLLLLAIAAPWYIAIYLDQGQAFIDGFIMKHNVGRFSATMLGHGGSRAYYFIVLPLLLLPFTGLLFAVLGHLREQWRDPLDRYLWLTFFCVFGFFSFSATQLPHYLLYGVTPLAILLAKHRQRLASGWLAYLPALLLGSMLLFLPELVGLRASEVASAQFQDMFARMGTTFGLTWRIGTGLYLAVVLLMWFQAVPRARGLMAVGLAQAALVALVVLPVAGHWQQGPVVAAAQESLKHPGTVVTWGVNYPSFGVYRGLVTPVRPPEPGEIALIRSNRLPEYPGAEILFQSGSLVLAKIPDLPKAPTSADGR